MSPTKAMSFARSPPLPRYGLEPSTLSPEQQAAFATILARRGDFPVPFRALLSSPSVALSVDSLSTLLWSGHLSKDALETVFLVVAKRFRCEHQWQRHEIKALAAGVSPECIRAIAAGLKPQAPEHLAVAYQVAKRLVSGQRVGQRLWSDANRIFGEPGLADLVAFLGLASLVAMSINVQHA